MAIIGTTGTSGTNAYFRISVGGSVPFGATAVGASGTFGRSMAMNIYPPNSAGVPWATTPFRVSVLNVSSWNPFGAVASRWQITQSAPSSWGNTAGRTGGWNPSGVPGPNGEVSVNSGTTALFFNVITNLDTFTGLPGDFSAGGFPAQERGTMISLTNTNGVAGAGAVIYFRTNGLPVWAQDPSTSLYYVSVPVAHVSGTWSAVSGPMDVELDAPAAFSWHGTPGGNKVWAGPDEINRLIIAHPVPTLGGSAVIGATGTQTQPLRPGVNNTTPDSPSGGVGFWGISRFTPPGSDDTYVGNMLTGAGATSGDHSSTNVTLGAVEAFKRLCASIAGQSAGYFVTPGQAQNYVDINGWWTNYAGTGASNQNRP
jgi:hypothetical protein